jgi:hypothetical protein
MAVGARPDQVSEDHGAADGDGLVAERNGAVGVVGAVDGDDDKVVEQVLAREGTNEQTNQQTNKQTNKRSDRNRTNAAGRPAAASGPSLGRMWTG